jgi:hypothetical protein
VNRIFLSIAIVSNLFLAVNYGLGWAVRDPSVAGSTGVGLPIHFLCGVASITLAMLVHAIVLTYFMGTGRWIEETTAAYSLGTEERTRNIRLKYRTLPGMVGCLFLLIIVAAFGAAADPGAALDFAPAKTIHMTLATLALLVNIGVSFAEYNSICRNHELMTGILNRVHTIRRERGLD